MLHSEKRSEPLRRTDLFLSRSDWDALKKVAQEKDISASELVRRLIAAELKRAARKQLAVPGPHPHEPESILF
jgi:hypothetical protein